ncbi:ATP-binding protein [bacterium]
MLEELFTVHRKHIKDTSNKTKRYLYKQIDFNLQALCIFGSRGVGKTTMLLQYCIEKYDGNPEKCLYFSGDHVSTINYGLYNIAKEYFKHGGESIIIDEVHKYPNWAQEVKNIIDIYKEKKIILSGSSQFSLVKGKYDLSRRVVYYELGGLSFREFLNFETKSHFEKIDFQHLIKNHVKCAEDIASKISVFKYFKEYLRIGYYPFYLEGKNAFFNRVNNVIEKILFEDIGTIYNVKQTHIPTLKKILWLISSSSPFIPNIDKMSRELKISKEYVYNYLNYLETTGLVMNLRYEAEGFKLIRKPAKVYIENTNLISAITGAINLSFDIGSLRETFFVNQLRNKGLIVTTHEKADFLVNNKIVFELGGNSKTSKQITDIKNAYLVQDNIEIGYLNKIPLYLFGFLY